MLEAGERKIPDTLGEMIDPKRTALLLWDVEYAIAPNAFNFQQILPNLRSLAELARKIGIPVFYSQRVTFHLEREEGDVWVRIRVKRAAAASPDVKIPAGKRGQDIIEELKPQAGDTVFQMRRPDGFFGTHLDLMLRNRGIRTVVMGGVATEGGVEGTARTGRNLGYYMVVLKDCVGSKNRELHDLALKLMEKMQFDMATSKEVADIWQRKGAVT